MFSIKSSKELAQRLEEQLVKGKDHLPLNGEDPQSSLLSEHPMSQSKTSPEILYASQKGESEVQESILQDRRHDQSLEKEPKEEAKTEILIEKKPKRIQLQPLFEKLKSAFNRYVLENVNISAVKIKQMLQGRYEEVDQTSSSVLEESLEELNESVNFQLESKLLQDQSEEDSVFQIGEPDR